MSVTPTTRLEAILEMLTLLQGGLTIQGVSTEATAQLHVDQLERIATGIEDVAQLLDAEELAILRDNVRRILTLLSTAVPVSIDAVAVSNFPATQPVSIATTVPVSVAGSVGISNFPATQSVSGAVAVSNLPATQPVSAVALPLPAGAAADASLAALLAELLLKAKLTDTQPVSAAALPLPAGAATEASLALLRAQLPVIGQTSSLAALPVVFASDQDSISDRYRRHMEEDGLVETMDLGAVALATRSRSERVSFADRRGRTSRGTNR